MDSFQPNSPEPDKKPESDRSGHKSQYGHHSGLPSQNGQPAHGPYHAAGLPTGAPRSQMSAKPRRGGTVLAVLISILLTFTLTLGLFYSLYAFGILEPAFAEGTGDPTDGSETGGLGLTVDSTDPATLAQARKLEEILKILQDNYFEELTEEEILGAISAGLPSNLGSPYTYYMTAEEYQDMMDSMQPTYSGIGATVTWNLGGFNEILDVTPNSPAEEAGVLPGDIPVEVDGQDVQELENPSQLGQLVRGPEGTDVTIKFFRPSANGYVTITMTRRTVITVSVTHRMLDDKIGFLRINSFTQDLLPQFAAAIDDLVASGAQHIVFDLRNNPGGSADSLIDVLDYILPEGEIARLVGREGGERYEESWTSDADMAVPDSMRYAILVNENSASASELFSGALRDWGKAVIIGENTYGKGSGTTTWRLSDGSALTVTIFEYILPSGDRVEGVGLPPQIESSLDPEDLTVPLQRLPEEDDNQLQAALDFFESGDFKEELPAA